jgi:dTDP-4-amino-4,6-dideoxygalactose transaminase
LILALAAAGVRPGDHVALPNLTFWATFEAEVHLGAVPVLIDVDPDDLQLDLGELRSAFERLRFRHVVTVHLFGWASARLAELRAFCRERDVTLLEDAAQAFGVAVGGAPIFAGASLATLSMYPAKVLGGAMDGGAVLCADAAQADAVRCLANHGRASHYRFAAVGYNSRMSSAAAGYLLEVLPLVGDLIAARRAVARRYRAAAAEWVDVAAHGPPAGVDDNGYLCVLACGAPVAEDRARELTAAGVGTARTYPETVDQQRPAAGRFVATGDFAVSRAFCRRVLNLPLYYGITEEQVTQVLEAADLVFGRRA